MEENQVIMNNNTIKNYEDLLVRAPYLPNSIALHGCEKIILHQAGIDVKFELDNENIRKFKQMYINGIGFVRSEAFCEELENRLPKDIKFQVMEIIQDLFEDWKQ